MILQWQILPEKSGFPTLCGRFPCRGETPWAAWNYCIIYIIYYIYNMPGYCVCRGSSGLCWWVWDELEERYTGVNINWFLGVKNQLVSAWLQHALAIMRETKPRFSSNLCHFHISKSADSSGISPEFLWYKTRTKNSLCSWNLGFHSPSISTTKTTLFRHELFHI